MTPVILTSCVSLSQRDVPRNNCFIQGVKLGSGKARHIHKPYTIIGSKTTPETLLGFLQKLKSHVPSEKLKSTTQKSSLTNADLRTFCDFTIVTFLRAVLQLHVFSERYCIVQCINNFSQYYQSGLHFDLLLYLLWPLNVILSSLRIRLFSRRSSAFLLHVDSIMSGLELCLGHCKSVVAPELCVDFSSGLQIKAVSLPVCVVLVFSL